MTEPVEPVTTADQPPPEATRSFDYGPRGRVFVVPDGAALARTAAEIFVRAMADAVATHNRATVALSGGSTPKRMGELLAAAPYREPVPWSEIEVFWGDERWEPLASPHSNAGEAKRTLQNNSGNLRYQFWSQPP